MSFYISLMMFFLTSAAQGLTVTSLNIEWYGRGGEMGGSLEDEYRDERIKAFLSEEIPHSDVYVFQEVTQPEALQRIFPEKVCVTYDGPSGRHQFVVICVEHHKIKSFYPNRKVQMGRSGLRPALVTQIEYGDKKIKLVGVHLKAGFEKTSERLEQTQHLYKEVQGDEHALLIGDFNTYPKERTGLDYSDEDYISNLFLGNHIYPVQTTGVTYLGYKNRKFDLAWVKGLVVSRAQIFGPCEPESVMPPYSDPTFYERFISDHCALQVEVD